MKVQMKNKLKITIATLALALAWLAPAALAAGHFHNDNCISNRWVSTWSKHTVDSDFGYLTVSDYSWTQALGYNGLKTRWDREYNVEGVLVNEFFHVNEDAFLDILVVIQDYSCVWQNYWGYDESDSSTSQMTIKPSGNPACTNLSVYVTGMGWRRSIDNAWQYDTNISTASHPLQIFTRSWVPPAQITSFEGPQAVHWAFAW